MQYKPRHVLLIILTVIIASGFTGCFSNINHSLTGEEAYNSAVSQLYGSDFKVVITAEQTIKHGNQMLTETTATDVFYNDYGTSKMRASLQATVTLNESSFSYSEIYVNGKTSLDINSKKFTADLSEDQTLLRYASKCKLFTPSLYEQVVDQYSDDFRIIGFSQPTQAEAWALPAGAEFIEASGSAVLQSDGKLYESTYSITYTCGAATIASVVTVRFDLQNKHKISMPAEIVTSVFVSNIDAPVLLETACARLLSTCAVTAQSTYTVSCEAGGLQRVQSTQTRLTGLCPNLEAQVDTTVELVNLSQQGTVRSHKQTEVFTNGKYTIDSDSNYTQSADQVTEDTMRTYCKNNLVSSVMLPQYISEVEIEETAQSYLLSFTASEELSQLLFSNAYQSLYNDQSGADAVRSYTTQSVIGHIEIDRDTCLPICSGMSYEGINTIDLSTYAFRVDIKQNYSY